MAAYTARGLRRRRARLAVGAAVVSASLLSMYSGAFRAAPTYAASPAAARRGPLQPLSLNCPAYSTEVADDTQLRAAALSADDSDTICLTADIALSATLVLDDTSVTFVGGTPSIELAAPAGDRHILANFDDTQQDELVIASLTLTGGSTTAGGGSVYVNGNFKDSIHLYDDTFSGNRALGNGGAIYVHAQDEIGLRATSVTMTDDSAAAGGAIAMYSVSGQASALVLGGYAAPSVFADDTAAVGNGGAIYIDTRDGQAIGAALGAVDFSHTTSAGSGGAIATHADVMHGGELYNVAALSFIFGSFYGLGVPSFSYNEAADRGGAVYSSGMVLTSFPGAASSYISGGLFEHNRANFGGALAAPYVLARRNVFSENSATAGGGAVALDDTGVLLAESSIFDSNTTGGAGGAIYQHDVGPFGPGQVLVGDATFTGNQALGTVGGALFVGESSVELTNVTLADNLAHLAGGAVYAGASTIINFSTITGNTAPFTAGGIVALTDLDIANSIVWDNAAADDSDVHVLGSGWGLTHSLMTSEASSGGGIDDSTGSIFGQDPLLGPLQANGGYVLVGIPIPTMLTAWDSPVAEAASDDTTDFPEFDARGAGFPRVIGPRADMGATEYQMSVTALTPPSGPTAGGTNVIIEGAGFTHASAVSFGSQAATSFTVVDDGHITAEVPTGPAGPVNVTVTAGPHSVTVADAFAYIPPTPPPNPLMRPGAPTDVTARAGDASAVVSWKAPEWPGTSALTGYRVTSTPGEATCVSVVLTCTVPGLLNGTSYAFTVEAANSAGYGTASAPSNPVTPMAAPVGKSIVIAGTRDATAARPTVVVQGRTTRLVGATVVTHVRFPGQASYATGVAHPTVDRLGNFTWTRKTGKKTYVYFTSGDVESNRLVIPSAKPQSASVPTLMSRLWNPLGGHRSSAAGSIRDWVRQLLARD